VTPSRNILKKLENKAIIIEYIRGSAGNLVGRIIASDNKFYWDHNINNSYEYESNPIRWPKRDYKTRANTCESRYGWFDTTITSVEGRNSILKAMKSKKLYIFRLNSSLRHLNNNIKIIRIVGINNRNNRPSLYTTHPVKEFYKPIIHPNTYNLNINKLTSEDYAIFKKEYLALCSYLNLIPNTKEVKNFIDIWRIKQKT